MQDSQPLKLFEAQGSALVSVEGFENTPRVAAVAVERVDEPELSHGRLLATERI